MKRAICGFVFVALMSFPLQSQGQIVLEFETGQTVTVGAQISVSASIRSLSGTAVLSNYNIPIDIGNDGFGLPAGISIVSIESLNANFSNFSTVETPGAPFNFDLATSDSSGDGMPLESSPTDLFSITLAVDPAFPVGETFEIAFQCSPTPNPGLFALTLDGATVNEVDMVFNGTTNTRALILGDVNLDGAVNLLDVAGFIDRLGDGEFQIEADANQDGSVNLLDVGGFIDLISNGGT